jgi:16S rRNA processing protein RimM
MQAKSLPMIKIGKIVATHGLQGALMLSHEAGSSTWLKKSSAVFIEIRKGSMIPYFVAKARPLNDEEYLVELEEVNTVDEAKKILNRNVYVDEQMLNILRDTLPLLWIGYRVIDSEKGNLGIIEDVLSTPGQWLAKLIIEGKEVLLPLANDFIADLDVTSKTLHVHLPEGLLDIYLG